MSDEAYVTAKRAEVVRIASATINGELDIIEGVRRINDLRHYIDGADVDDAFTTILAVDSETEAFPVGALRALCAPEYLQRKDEERADYLAKVRDDIFAACHRIVKTYS